MSYLYIEADYREFKQAFIDANRFESFSPTALQALFDYLQEEAEEMGEPTRIDPIALCCQFSEISHEDFENDFFDEDEDFRLADVAEIDGVIAVLPQSVLFEHI